MGLYTTVVLGLIYKAACIGCIEFCRVLCKGVLGFKVYSPRLKITLAYIGCCRALCNWCIYGFRGLYTRIEQFSTSACSSDMGGETKLKMPGPQVRGEGRSHPGLVE